MLLWAGPVYLQGRNNWCLGCADAGRFLTCNMLLQQFETAAKEGRLEEVLAEGAIEMTPEEVQQLKAREAADSAAAGLADTMPNPPEAGPATPMPQRRPGPSADAATADTMRGQRPAESAAAAGPSQAYPSHSASPAPDRTTGASSPVDGPRAAAADPRSKGAESSVPSQQMPAQTSSAYNGLDTQVASPSKSSTAATGEHQSSSRQSMYQQPAGPQPPPGLLEREQFLTELRQRQQQEQQEAAAGAQQQQQRMRISSQSTRSRAWQCSARHRRQRRQRMCQTGRWAGRLSLHR
jgi:hypothetical protein